MSNPENSRGNGKRFRELALQIAGPVVVLLLIGGVWHGCIVAFDLKPFLLPGPLQVLEAATSNAGKIAAATGRTALAAVGGFLASLAVGTLIACGFSQSKLIRTSCYPYAIFLQTVPIVAIAPLIITWFGSGFRSVVIVAFIISLFPVITNATAGMLAQVAAAELGSSHPDRSSYEQRAGGDRRHCRRVFRRLRQRALRAWLSDSANVEPASHSRTLCVRDRLDTPGHCNLRINGRDPCDDSATLV